MAVCPGSDTDTRRFVLLHLIWHSVALAVFVAVFSCVNAVSVLRPGVSLVAPSSAVVFRAGSSRLWLSCLSAFLWCVVGSVHCLLLVGALSEVQSYIGRLLNR